jgi:hypothetical protein
MDKKRKFETTSFMWGTNEENEMHMNVIMLKNRLYQKANSLGEESIQLEKEAVEMRKIVETVKSETQMLRKQIRLVYEDNNIPVPLKSGDYIVQDNQKKDQDFKHSQEKILNEDRKTEVQKMEKLYDLNVLVNSFEKNRKMLKANVALNKMLAKQKRDLKDCTMAALALEDQFDVHSGLDHWSARRLEQLRAELLMKERAIADSHKVDIQTAMTSFKEMMDTLNARNVQAANDRLAEINLLKKGCSPNEF